MALDITKLQNVTKLPNNEIQARCPACGAAGLDKKGEHLKIFADGKYACAANQGDKDHRKEIFNLVGIPINGGSRFGLVSVIPVKVEDSTVLMDLSTYPRFRRKPKPEPCPQAQASTAETAAEEPEAAAA